MKSASTEHPDAAKKLLLTVPVEARSSHEAPSGRYFLTLCLGALGVVYGDIGTSPLYAIRELAAFGLRPAELAAFVEMAFAGKRVGSWWEEERVYDIVAKLPAHYVSDSRGHRARSRTHPRRRPPHARA